jgi:RimJ/RimL family protein N-acetyltransferase
MQLTHDTISLRALTTREASDITAGNRPSAGWADDFPGEGDLIAARYARVAPPSSEPWRTQWLILVDGLVSGTIGFGGEPVMNCLEVGYGVVPSRRGHGVATAALTQLLALIEGRGFTIRAETTTHNLASQSVLRHLSFAQVTERDDPTDGALIVWERAGSGLPPS